MISEGFGPMISTTSFENEASEVHEKHDSIVLSTKKDLLMKSLIVFFKERDTLDLIKPIIAGKSGVSLRILDWFVTNYSKKNNIHFPVHHNNGTEKNFIVYLDYKSQLKAYSKSNFDPFCRRERISFYDHDNKELITTVGQLNFFKWIIENNILPFVIENYKQVEDDMNTCLNQNGKKEGKKNRRKRTALSICATKTVNKQNLSIIVKFD